MIHADAFCAPASIHTARAAIDAQGKVVAYEFKSKGFSRVDVNTNGSKLFDTLAMRLIDLHPHNFLADGTRIVAILDFDSLRYVERMRALATPA